MGKKNNQENMFSYNPVVLPAQFQKKVLNFFRSNKLSVLTGDPGTGKTFLSLYHALTLLRDNAIEEIIISKSLQEVGKSMGFLPGSEEEKISAYMDSYCGAINKLLGNKDAYKHLVLSKKIRFEPVNFVRGNNFERCMVILDEAQSLDLKSLMAIATRLSDTSTMIMMGDIFQSDIKESGLPAFLSIIEGVEGTGTMELGREYQMRSKLVVDIYENYKKHIQNESLLHVRRDDKGVGKPIDLPALSGT